jgi:hypothetical protein
VTMNLEHKDIITEKKGEGNVRAAWGGVTGACTRQRAWTPKSTEASAVREEAGDGGTPLRGQTLTSSWPAWGEVGVSEGRILE